MHDGDCVVLVHGAHHGGWCWRRVADRLTRDGHRVYAPSQTGLGERRHLMSASITMQTFVDDIVNLLVAEELTDVVLVAHSFGGRTCAGVADQRPDLLRRLVLLDAALPLDGRSRLDALPPHQRAARLAAAAGFDGGVSAPPPPASFFGIADPADQAWADRQLSPQPIGSEATAVELHHPLGNGLATRYVYCSAPPSPAIASSVEFARTESGWEFVELAAPHDAMITHPAEVAELIVRGAPTSVGARRGRPSTADPR